MTERNVTMDPVTGYLTIAGINALFNTINQGKQRDLTSRINANSQRVSRENLVYQIEENRKSRYIEYIRSAEGVAWPLKIPKETYLEILGRNNGYLPLNIIFGNHPSTPNQVCLKEIWTQVEDFIIEAFPRSGITPVIVNDGFKATATGGLSDLEMLFKGLALVPTIFISPSASDNDQSLSIRISCWGMDGGRECEKGEGALFVKKWTIPTRQIFIDSCGAMVQRYLKRVRQGVIQENQHPLIQRWTKIFSDAKKLMDSGLDYEEAKLFGAYAGLEMTVQHANTDDPRTDVFNSMAVGIAQPLKIILATICDAYFVLRCGASSRLVKILSESNGNPFKYNGKECVEALGKAVLNDFQLKTNFINNHEATVFLEQLRGLGLHDLSKEIEGCVQLAEMHENQKMLDVQLPKEDNCGMI